MDSSQDIGSAKIQDSVAPATHKPSEGKVAFRFVEQGSGEEPRSARAGLAKAHHRKSRNGCLRCRARRVKCDEIHPMCSSCTRHKAVCVYEQVVATSAQRPQVLNRSISESGTKSVDSNSESGFGNSEHDKHDESSARRMLELKLMHTYNTSTCHTIFWGGDPTASETCIYRAPDLALTNNALLYCLLSFTAHHLAHCEPSSAAEMTFNSHRYWAMGLEEHKNDLKILGQENFDAVCVTSIFVRLNAFVMLRERPLVPYRPPTEWFQTTRGAMQVFAASWPWVMTDSDSNVFRLSERMPFCFDEEAKFAVANRQHFLRLLSPVEGDVLEDMSADDQAALKGALSYIGGVWLLTKDTTAPPAETARRLIVYPYLVHARFGELIEAQHPRALVMLGYYFALLFRFRETWWIDVTSEREVRALAAALSGGWRELMRWPLDVVDERNC